MAVTKLGPQQASHSLRTFFLTAAGSCSTCTARGTRPGSTWARSTGATDRLTPADSTGVSLPSGWLLWVQAGTLVAQRLDLARGPHGRAGDPGRWGGQGPSRWRRRVWWPTERAWGQPAAADVVRPGWQDGGHAGPADGGALHDVSVLSGRPARGRGAHSARELGHLADRRHTHEPLHV